MVAYISVKFLIRKSCYLFFIWLAALGLVISIKGQQKYELNNNFISEKINEAQKLSKQLNADALRRSIVIFEEISESLEKAGEFEQAADYLRGSAQAQLILGNKAQAKLILTKVLQIDRRYSNSFKHIQTLQMMSVVEMDAGQLKTALAYVETAKKLAKSTENSSAIALAFHSEGLTLYEGGEFSKATISFEKALSFWENAQNKEWQMRTLYELSYAYMTEDKLNEALEKALNGLQIAIELNDLKYKLFSQIAISVIKSKLGKKQEALDLFLETERDFPEEVCFLEKGQLFNHLASIYFDFDNLDLALKYRLKALENYRKVDQPFAQLAVLSKLGIITFKLGDKTKGLHYFEEGFELARKLQNDYFFPLFAQDLGNLYFETDKNEALKYYRMALPKFEKTKIRTHIAILKSKIGSIMLAQGNFTDARNYFEEALFLNRETKNSLDESENLFNLAKLSTIQNRTDEALEFVSQSIKVTESLTSQVVNAKLKSNYFSSIFDRYELFIELSMKKHREKPDDGFDLKALKAAEQSRARMLLESINLTGADFNKNADPETIRIEKELRTALDHKSNRLTDLLSKTSDSQEISNLSSEINELNARLENLRAQIKQKTPYYSSIISPTEFDLNEFQNSVLDDRTLLLEFALGTEQSYLWLIGKTQFKSFVLPPREQIESKAQKLREILALNQVRDDDTIEAYETRVDEAQKEFEKVAKSLSEEIFGPIANQISGKRLIIVPDGKLRYVPVSALPFPFSDDFAPILVTNEIVYQSSAMTLQRLIDQKNQNSETPSKFMVLFDPIFTETDPRIQGKMVAPNTIDSAAVERYRFAESLGNLPRLPNSKDEGLFISNILGKEQTDSFDGFSATRQQFLNTNNANYKLIHFATHALVNENRPELSGIILTGFTQAGHKQSQVLRLSDIYSLNLNAELIVLSACETGIGKDVKGEGLQSLNNAFLAVGAKSVVASLWKVEDTAALELMKNFYVAMAENGQTNAEALRSAQLKMYKNPRFKSPFYWSAFNFHGDFNSHSAPLQKNKVLIKWLAPVVFVLLAIFLFLLIRKRRIGD